MSDDYVVWFDPNAQGPREAAAAIVAMSEWDANGAAGVAVALGSMLRDPFGGGSEGSDPVRDAVEGALAFLETVAYFACPAGDDDE